MKKNSLSVLMLLSVTTLAIISFYSFRPTKSVKPETTVAKTKPDQSGCSTSHSCVLYDYCCVVSPCTDASCPWTLPPTNCSLLDYKVSNFGWTVSGTTVTFNTLAVCYKYSATPPWTTSAQIGILMKTSLRPSTTRVISATASNGSTFQCTIYANGDWYIQKTAGTNPGQGTALSGSYTL